MDSHGSAPPIPPARTGAAGRSAGGAPVTRRRQADQPPREIPYFRDVEHLPDGTWRAVHVSTGETIAAPTFEHLERVEAPMVRLLHGWRSA